MTDNFDRALQERLLARSQVSPREVEALRLFARTLPAKRSFWSRPALAWGFSAAALLLAAAVALPPIISRMPGFGSTPTPTATASPTPTPAPTAPASPAPTPSAPVNTPEPSVGLGPIRLAVVSGSIVDVVISDRNGLVTGAVTEQANPGMSFAWENSKVEAVPGTANAMRVTWVGYPRDEEVRLEVTDDGSGGLLLQFFQDAPIPNTDGEGEDRVMILYLGDAVDPADVEVTFTDPS